MKRRTYKILRFIPIVGSVVESLTTPLQITGSVARADGFADECSNLVKEYLKTHPDEQVTRQLIDRLLAEHRNKNNPQV